MQKPHVRILRPAPDPRSTVTSVATTDLRRFRQHPALLRAAEFHGLSVDSVGHALVLYDDRICLRLSASRASTTVKVDVHWPQLGVSAGFDVLCRRPDAVIGAAAFREFKTSYQATSTDPTDAEYEVGFAWMMHFIADVVEPEHLRSQPGELRDLQPDTQITTRADPPKLIADIRGLVAGEVPPMYVQLLPSEDPDVMGSSYPQINAVEESAVPTSEIVDQLRLGGSLDVEGIDPNAFLMKASARETDVMSAGMHLGRAGLFVSPSLASELAAYTLHQVTETAVTLNARFADHARDAVFLHVADATDLIDMEASVFTRSNPTELTERHPLATVDEWRDQLDADITSGRADRLRPERIELTSYPDLFRMPITGQLCASRMLISMLKHQGRSGWRIQPLGLPGR